MTRRELELEVKLLKQKMKTLELELELVKRQPDKEYVPYWPTIHPYPVYPERIGPPDPYRIWCETATTGTGSIDGILNN